MRAAPGNADPRAASDPPLAGDQADMKDGREQVDHCHNLDPIGRAASPNRFKPSNPRSVPQNHSF